MLDASIRHVLRIGDGRSRESIRLFFEWLGKQRCACIKAAAIDINTAFDLEVQAHCPNARVVYDLFRVIAKYGREVIDRVRVNEANRPKQARPTQRCQTRALAATVQLGRVDRSADQLEELLAANQAL